MSAVQPHSIYTITANGTHSNAKQNIPHSQFASCILCSEINKKIVNVNKRRGVRGRQTIVCTDDD